MEKVFWQHQWDEGSTGWDLGRPHKQCGEILNHIKLMGSGSQKRVLVPGCGSGHDAAFFARHGFEVIGCDLIDTALDKANALYGTIDSLQFVQGDVFDLNSFPLKSFDLIYDRAMLCALKPEMRGRYIENCQKWLKGSGLFVSLLFSKRSRDPEKGPPFEVSVPDFIQLIKDFLIIEDVFEYPSEDIDIISQEVRVICRLKGEA